MITRTILVTALFAIPLIASADVISSALTSPFSSYDLVLDYHEDRLVLDHGMTMGDCFDALPRNDPYRGTSFSCVLHGKD